MRISRRPGNLGGYRGFAGTGIVAPVPAAPEPTQISTVTSQTVAATPTTSSGAVVQYLPVPMNSSAAALTLPNRLTLTEADWMRSSGAIASRIDEIPEGFDEAKYLEKHPDVAQAVKEGVMPSGLWHYLKYGKEEGRALAGWRRPGFLSGIFSNWTFRD